MRVRFLRGPRRVLAIGMCALAQMAFAAWGQVTPSPPTLEASSRIAGAVPSQTMDTGMIAAGAANQAVVNDSFSGPIQVGGLALGSGMVMVSASSGEGTANLFSQASATATAASVAIVTSVEARASDTVQISQLPGGQGELSALYFPTMLAAGGTITGSGASWSATIHLTAMIEDFAPDGSLRAGYTLAADSTNGNNGSVSHDTGPVSIPVQLNDTLTMDVDEVLQTSTSATRGASSTVSADFSRATRLFLVPLSSGLAFTSASGHSYLPLAGDTNVDGKVDFSDLLTLAQNYGATGATWAQGDFNADGAVGFGDLLALAQNYGQSADGSLTSGADPAFTTDVERNLAEVPQPSSASLLAIGALGLLWRARRVRSRTLRTSAHRRRVI